LLPTHRKLRKVEPRSAAITHNADGSDTCPIKLLKPVSRIDLENCTVNTGDFDVT